MPKTRLPPLIAAASLMAGCGSGSLADAEGQRLTADDAARLIADHSTVAGDSQVVRFVAEL